MRLWVKVFVLCVSICVFPVLLFAEDEVLFYHTDNFGTPIVMTDVNGKVVWRADELPFGEEYKTQEVSTKNDRRFLGKELDKETGLIYMGARYLDPATGRFNRPDPVQLVDPHSGKINQEMLLNPQQQNRYVYGLNNPYRYVDPDGHTNIDIIIDRKNENNQRTLGNITIKNSTTNKALSLKSLELPDRNNKKNVSRVNSGAYNAIKSNSQKFGDVIRLDMQIIEPMC